MKIEKIMVVENNQGFCYCGIGKKNEKQDIKVEGGLINIRYCPRCKTAYLKRSSYDPELFKRYQVEDDVEKNEQLIIKMQEEAKIRIRNKNADLAKRQRALKEGAKIVGEKEIAKVKEAEEYKKMHGGKIEIYSHDMEKHYSKPYPPKSPKEKSKRSFFS